MRFTVEVQITPRAGVSDPEGQTIERAMPVLGFEGVSSVRTGKLITFELQTGDPATARELVDDICERFLCNPVIEDAVAKISAATVVS